MKMTDINETECSQFKEYRSNFVFFLLLANPCLRMISLQALYVATMLTRLLAIKLLILVESKY